MKIKINTKELLSSLKNFKTLIEKRNTLPILQCLKLEVCEEGKTLKLTGTDIDIWMKDIISVEILESSELKTIAVNYESLLGLISKISKIKECLLRFETYLMDGEVKYSINVACDNLISTIQCPDKCEDFPEESEFIEGESGDGFEINSKILHSILKKLEHSISTESTRYYLNGVCVKALDFEIDFVSTNGHTLSLIKIEECCGEFFEKGIILPTKTVKHLLNVLNKKDTNVVINQLGEVRLEICFENVNIISKLVDGTYPDYKRVIPNTLYIEPVVIDKNALINAINIVNQTIARVPCISFKISKDNPNKLKIFQNENDKQSKIEIEIENKGLKDIEIGMNARYLLEVLKHIDSDSVCFWFTDSDSPIVIKPAIINNEYEDCLNAIMSMRIE